MKSRKASKGAKLKVAGKQAGGASMRALIQEEIRALIHTGELAPDEMISERSVLERFQGASRTPVSHVLQSLAAEGVLEHVPHQGARVLRFTADDTARLLSLREVIEVFLVRQLASRPSSDVTLLLQNVEYQQATIKSRDKRRFLSLGNDFHRQVTRLAGYEVVEDIIGQFWSRSTSAYSQRLSSTALDETVNLRDMQAINDEHRAIAKALAIEASAGAELERRISAAEAAVREHFRMIRRRAGVDPAVGVAR